ncbi:hypothetical protein DRQ15_06205 [candidate division KSB1 bacterium]|nr:MAG: hypothetical protein DRQ12_07305 [candidate division KSB1 bacterium]RKY87867.1 MAG: hypothetical protein DRQ11_05175 [candidate division KSB1 bacterium]RKY90942.1 MAG: hypothetical protein DRQ15_06205 [candidate division KSB1 bacterium]
MKLLYFISHTLLNFLFRIFYGLKVVGYKEAPLKGAVIVAVNHQSFFDPLIAGTAVERELYYFAKQEIFQTPVIGTLAKAHNAFPTKRGFFDIGAVRQAANVLQEGNALLMFPEGTRSRTGKLLKAKMGIGMVAYHNRADIVPMYLHGTFRLRECLFRYPGLIVNIGQRIPIRKYLEMKLPRKEIYQQISNDVMSHIAELKRQTLQKIKKRRSS